jgi:rubrerythrin
MVTTIQVTEETAEELAARKRRGDTYDHVIRRLLDGTKASAEAASSGAEGESERIRCEHCGHVWTTQSGAQRPTCPSCSSKTDRASPS